MGQRGPLKGQAGRPPGGNKPRDQPPPTRSGFAADLAALDLETLERQASQFRPLTDADCVMVRLLWDTIQRYHEVHQAMQGKPLTYQTDKGYQGQVPEVSMLNKCIEQIVTLSAKFGMSPADRTRLGEAPPTDTKKKADPFEAHLKLVGNL